MMTFFINAYPGRSGYGYAGVHYTRAGADYDVEPGRVGIWRVRPKTQRAFQELHLRGSMSISAADRRSASHSA